MTTVDIDPATPDVTESEVRSNFDVEERDESTRARVARARVKSIVTDGSVELQRAARQWWVITTRPMSIRAAWRAGALVDVRRVPLRHRGLELWWRWDNRIGTRPLLFALALVAPHVLTGPILWCAARPARRAGLVAVSAALALGLWLAGR